MRQLILGSKMLTSSTRSLLGSSKALQLSSSSSAASTLSSRGQYNNDGKESLTSPSLSSLFRYGGALLSSSSLSKPIGSKRYAFEITRKPADIEHHLCKSVVVTKPEDVHLFQTIRMLDTNGKLVDGVKLPFSMEECLKMYKCMVQLNVYDHLFYDIQRQGRISFYATTYGEEAECVATSAALEPDDLICSQYREAGALLWRGLTLKEMLEQCLAKHTDPARGRQMPIHYQGKKYNSLTISSPLTIKVPQAAGAGYAFRNANKNAVAISYVGEGAASEGDFAVGLNFAAVFGAQTIFVVRNNGWAISTPSKEQFKGDGTAGRGIAYGMDTIRVDGNDLVAVYAATKKAREICVKEHRPVFMELMSYRISNHSTSDDAQTYRSADELKMWEADGITPISRTKKFLIANNQWSEEQDKELWKTTRKDALHELRQVDKQKRSSILEGLFTDVYDKPLWTQLEQRKELETHLNKHKDKYPELAAFQGI